MLNRIPSFAGYQKTGQGIPLVEASDKLKQDKRLKEVVFVNTVEKGYLVWGGGSTKVS